MLKLPFYWIDAFTYRKRSGNPCAVVLDADALSNEEMLSIAKEMNLSETAFVCSSEKADFGARYFTPQGELPFAGHPTIATIHALIHAKRLEVTSTLTQVTLELPVGVIPIDIVSDSNRIKIIMSQPAPKFLRVYNFEEIASIYGLSLKDLLQGAPIQTVSTGTPILMIPLSSQDAVRRVQYVNVEAYKRLKETGDFFFSHHFCLEGATNRGTTFARSLGTPPNLLEDPFTGSATGCMAAYLWKYRLISSACFLAEQGHWIGRPGEAEVEIIGSPDNIHRIRVSGEAVTVISGIIDI